MSAQALDGAGSSRLLLNDGGRRFSTLSSVNDVVTVHRPRGDLETLIFMIPVSVLALMVITAGAIAVALMAWIAITEFSLLAMLMAAMFGVGLAICLWVFSLVQGLFFPFKVILDARRYCLANGFVRAVRPCRLNEAEVVICPVYMRGDWGFAARIRPTNRSWKWPLVPARVIGSKHEALQKAIRLKEWFEQNTGVGRVALQKWGSIECIKPGVDYIT